LAAEKCEGCDQRARTDAGHDPEIRARAGLAPSFQQPGAECAVQAATRACQAVVWLEESGPFDPLTRLIWVGQFSVQINIIMKLSRGTIPLPPDRDSRC
jgi:hypothetical protein